MIRLYSLARCSAVAWPRRTGRMLPLCLAALALVTGCQVGPKYVRPSAPVPPAYKENQPGTNLAQAEGWKQANPQDEMLRGKWWEIFQDPDLNALRG